MNNKRWLSAGSSKIVYNNKRLFFKNHPTCTRDYFQYILSLLKTILIENDLSVNILIDVDRCLFKNKNRTIRIGVNTEHTLVKAGGRDFPESSPIGNVKCDNSTNYHVRINELERLNSCDIVIDYSQPNIFNVKSSGLFDNFSKKHIYIAPCIYDSVYSIKDGRENSTITSFFDTNQYRRKKLIEQLKVLDFDHTNINCFDKTGLEKIYRNTKILINIHQTGEHNTFEELRCLPAVANGTIVVSEKPPLHHLVPYQNMIVWCSYDDIANQVEDVLTNYHDVHNKLFSTENINVINNLDSQNKKNLEEKILSVLT